MATSLDDLNGPFDIIINGISAGLHGEMPALPSRIWGSHTRAYDMVYGPSHAVLTLAAEHGAVDSADGLGMLVGQAAEAFSSGGRFCPLWSPFWLCYGRDRRFFEGSAIVAWAFRCAFVGEALIKRYFQNRRGQEARAGLHGRTRAFLKMPLNQRFPRF